MPISTGAPRKIRWQGVVPERGSDPKLVSIGRARAAPSVQGPPAPVRGWRVKRWRTEAGPIGVAIAGAQRLLELTVAQHSPHGAGELRASVRCDDGVGGEAGDPAADDSVCAGLGRGGDHWDGLNPPASAVSGEHAAPAMSEEPAAPAMSVEQAAPAVSVEPAAPAMSIEQAAPAMSVDPAAPAKGVDPAAPAKGVEQAVPAMNVDPAAPGKGVDPAAPAKGVEQAAPAMSVDPAAPAKGVEQAAPAMSVKSMSSVYCIPWLGLDSWPRRRCPWPPQ
jgi:hypothetical protein